LLEGLENDPLSRAGLINDIVSSISKIPSDIVRSEYLKECSRLLNVREELLYNEIRNLNIKTRNNLIQNKERELIRETNVKKPNLISAALKHNPCENEEHELLKMLIKYGPHKIFEIENDESGELELVYVAGYILSELEADQMESVDPIIRKIIDEYRDHLEIQDFDALKYFVNHPDNQISQLISDILSEKNKLSSFWKKRGNFIEEEHDILYQLVPKVLQEYKLRYISSIIAETWEGIKTATNNNDFDKVAELQMRHQKLKVVEAQLCDQLGKRTISF
jgi:DNA primase